MASGLVAVVAIAVALAGGCGGEKAGAGAGEEAPGSKLQAPGAGDTGMGTVALTVAEPGTGTETGTGMGTAAEAGQGADVPPLDAAPAVRDPGATGKIRLVVVFTDEVLRSEARGLDDLEATIVKVARVDVLRADADAAERAVATAYLATPPAATPPPLPAAWSTVETVVVVEVLPPTGEKPDRRSRGVGGILVFRPPLAEPVFVERVAGELGYSLRNEDLLHWVASTIGMVALKEPP